MYAQGAGTSLSPDGTGDTKLMDEAYMAHVIGLAQHGWGQVAPNPLVGALVVNGAEIVGSGYHARFGESHAEIVALEEAGVRARGATLYVNLEPCNHSGKTPPCAEAIINAGIARVVAANRDPNPVASGGAERLRAGGIVVDFGVCDTEAREINAAFFNSFASDRPWVTLKLAMSLDGSIAPADGSTAWLTGETSRQLVHRMRASNDAIAVGWRNRSI
ncbi:MAG TPA: bifunctional diaminohydroxyphosphoribosylaminopyrimidine deaminase/5-amino-6-(5-phosphoribosylamino)uracil reductase RibD, partial [Gemmatimonadaceae bacterium]|nr:bifunctional diaminohydroxyphosphoribosylaminopyrimidine deaminase/5-amino-6-(5-phosphoribosylamino)uracil reductase RibD [Gemmatimonadaceae bacterium]